MLKYLKFAYHVFCNRAVMNFLLIFQLTTAFLLLQGMITYTAEKYSSVTAFEPMSNINGIHFSTEYEGDLNGIFEGIKKNHSDIDIASGIHYAVGNGMGIMFYEPQLVEYYFPNMSKGKWLSESLTNDPNIIPAVAVKGYSAGERVPVLEDISIEIIGVIEDKHYLSFDSYGTEMRTQLLMEPLTENIFLALINPDIAERLDVYAFGKSNVYLFMTKSNKTLYDVSKVLSEYGEVTSFNDIMKNGQSNAFEQLRIILPFFVFAYILSIFGLISGVVLTVAKNINMFTVMYAVGATRVQCVLIILTNIMFHVGGAVILYRLVGSIIFPTLSGFFANTMHTCIFLCCIIAIGASVIPLSILRTDKILHNIKNR